MKHQFSANEMDKDGSGEIEFVEFDAVVGKWIRAKLVLGLEAVLDLEEKTAKTVGQEDAAVEHAAVEDARVEAAAAEQPAVQDPGAVESVRKEAAVGESDSEPEPQVEKQQAQEPHRSGLTPESETPATLPELSVETDAPPPPGLADIHDDANAGWEEYSDDENDGKLYYRNERLGKSVWTPPPGFVSSRTNTANVDPIFGNELPLDDLQALAP